MTLNKPIISVNKVREQNNIYVNRFGMHHFFLIHLKDVTILLEQNNQYES